MNPDVDKIIAGAKQWRAEMEQLQRIALDCGLTEVRKWYQPVYTHSSANLLIIGAFKNYCSLGFFKGALLTDPHGLLQKPGDNTQSSRLLKFTHVEEILQQEDIIRAYILESIKAEEAGLKVAFKKITEHAVPEELEKTFGADPELEAAFRALTPGRQRAYLLHFSSAKQSSTRVARIEKCRPRIIAGKGLND